MCTGPGEWPLTCSPSAWVAFGIKLIFPYSRPSHILSQETHGNSVITAAQIVCGKFTESSTCVLQSSRQHCLVLPTYATANVPQILLKKPHVMDIQLNLTPASLSSALGLTPKLYPWLSSKGPKTPRGKPPMPATTQQTQHTESIKRSG